MLLETIGNKRLYSKVLKVLFMLLILSSLFGCSKKEEVLDQEPQILKINDQAIPTEEIMVYMYQVVEEFQKIGGDEVWEFEDFSGGKSATEVAKDAIFENIIRMKVLNNKAIELDIKLSDDELDQAKLQAADYFNNMSSEFIQANDITLVLMVDLFYEFAISEKVIEHITNNYIPEDDLINKKMLENQEYSRLQDYESLDLLIEYNVSHILLQTRRKDDNDNYIMLTEAEKEVKYNEALQVLERAKNNEDFEYLMAEFSDEIFDLESTTNGKYQFSKALLPEQFKESIINLKVGQISDLVESESGYHIFKVNDIIVPSEEEIRSFEENLNLYRENLKASVTNELKTDAFNELYFKWKESINISINRDVWDQVELQI